MAEHLEFLIHDERERSLFLDWCAWVVQHPGEKPNWAVVLGGGQGIGKDMAVEPLRAALGAGNVREIGQQELVNTTWWADRCKLVLVEEMHLFDRKDTMNKLKPLIAAPPYTININQKFIPQYQVPNLVALIFFTNMENALHLDPDDRRFLVIRSEAVPRSADYYRHLRAWYDDGGAEAAARWLLQRDISEFDAKGRAPATAAKEAMRKASRPVLNEWIEDDIRDHRGAFEFDIVDFQAVFRAAKLELSSGRFQPQRTLLSQALKAAGCRTTGQVRIGPSERTTLYVVRNHEKYADLSDVEIRDLFLAQMPEEWRVA